MRSVGVKLELNILNNISKFMINLLFYEYQILLLHSCHINKWILPGDATFNFNRQIHATQNVEIILARVASL